MSEKYDLERFFREVIAAIREEHLECALCGGLAASLYRDQPRLTNDIDFIVAEGESLEKRVRSVMDRFHLKAHPLRKAELDGGPLFAIKNRSSPVQAYVGRVPGDPRAIGLDFLLPNIAWAQNALERARFNMVFFADEEVPTITVEDLIIAKLHAFRSSREKDLDDLRSIFRVGHDLEISYLTTQMQRFALELPPSLESVAPETILLTSKTVQREKKQRRRRKSARR